MVFVTGYYDVYNNTEKQKQYFEWFRPLALSGLPICVFTCKEFVENFKGYSANITVIVEPLENFETYRVGTRDGIRLPPYRNLEKDTIEFMAIINSKAEMLFKAKQIITDSVYIWIDFGIMKLLTINKSDISEIDKLHKHIDFINKLHTIHSKCIRNNMYNILNPGCWEKVVNYGSVPLDRIQWRFCGGFLICPHHLVDIFYQHNFGLFKEACDKINTVWEVNIWSMIEDLLGENSYFHWYKGDHNETILPSWDIIHSM